VSVKLFELIKFVLRVSKEAVSSKESKKTKIRNDLKYLRVECNSYQKTEHEVVEELKTLKDSEGLVDEIDALEHKLKPTHVSGGCVVGVELEADPNHKGNQSKDANDVDGGKRKGKEGKPSLEI
jgi:hypothetical protein